MNALIIDDHPLMKIREKGLDSAVDLNLEIAGTIEEGISALQDSPKFDRLYLDYDMGGGRKGTEVLNWLADHLDKVPPEVSIVSFGCPKYFYQMAQSLEIAAKRAFPV